MMVRNKTSCLVANLRLQKEHTDNGEIIPQHKPWARREKTLLANVNEVATLRGKKHIND
jgi:hypothetical protein